jgi:hypothetical protein
MASLILTFAAGLGVLFVILYMMMLDKLHKRGVKINIVFIGLLIIRYFNQYKQITLEETGKVGPLFYLCIISINIAFVLTVVALILYF